MTIDAARTALFAAASTLEVLRPQATIAVGGSLREDEPIRQAWLVALEEFRDACDAWVRATDDGT